jgi:hypothetical protein
MQDSKTYYLNIINADISNADPAGSASLTSTKNGQCTTACGDPVRNGSISFK